MGGGLRLAMNIVGALPAAINPEGHEGKDKEKVTTDSHRYTQIKIKQKSLATEGSEKHRGQAKIFGNGIISKEKVKKSG